LAPVKDLHYALPARPVRASTFAASFHIFATSELLAPIGGKLGEDGRWRTVYHRGHRNGDFVGHRSTAVTVIANRLRQYAEALSEGVVGLYALRFFDRIDAKTRPTKSSRRGVRPYVAADIRDLAGSHFRGSLGHCLLS
jgi:hypothetical protein